MNALILGLTVGIVLPTLSFFAWLSWLSRKQKSQNVALRDQTRSIIGILAAAGTGAGLLCLVLAVLGKNRFSDEYLEVYIASIFSCLLFFLSCIALLILAPTALLLIKNRARVVPIQRATENSGDARRHI